MKNPVISVIVSAIILGLIATNARGQEARGGDCVSVSNPVYHINYYEMCGNRESPMAKGNEQTVTLWVDITTPTSATGKVWVAGLYLDRSDRTGKNLLENPDFKQGLWEGRKNNPMCRADDLRCRNIVESDDTKVWRIDNNPSKNPARAKSAVQADMSVLGKGYQAHMFCPLIDIAGTKPGTTFKAYCYVKIEGDVQVRLGIDFRSEAPAGAAGPLTVMRAVNGKIIRGSTGGRWVKLELR